MSDNTTFHDLAAHLAPAWLSRPKGDFVLVIVRLASVRAGASIRRPLHRVVEICGVHRRDVGAFLAAKNTELAAAVIAASPCGTKVPSIIFTIDASDERPALN